MFYVSLRAHSYTRECLPVLLQNIVDIVKSGGNMGTNDFVDGEIAGGDSTDPTLVNTNARGFVMSPKAERSLLHPLFR